MKKVKNLLKSEKGEVNLIAIIVISIVVIVIAMLFQDNLAKLVNSIFGVIQGMLNNASQNKG